MPGAREAIGRVGDLKLGLEPGGGLRAADLDRARNHAGPGTPAVTSRFPRAGLTRSSRPTAAGSTSRSAGSGARCCSSTVTAPRWTRSPCSPSGWRSAAAECSRWTSVASAAHRRSRRGSTFGVSATMPPPCWTRSGSACDRRRPLDGRSCRPRAGHQPPRDPQRARCWSRPHQQLGPRSGGSSAHASPGPLRSTGRSWSG